MVIIYLISYLNPLPFTKTPFKVINVYHNVWKATNTFCFTYKNVIYIECQVWGVLKGNVEEHFF